MTRLLLVVALVFSSLAGAGGQALPPAVCATIKQIRGTGAITSAAELGAMLNRIAWTHRADGWGLSSKRAGNHCPSPAGDIACDILQREGFLFDIFTAAGVGEITAPNCGDTIGPASDPSRPWVAPVDPGGNPPPPPPPPTGEVERLNARIAQLQAEGATKDQRITDLENDGRRAREAQLQAEAAVAERNQRIQELEAQLAAPVRCEAKAPSWLKIGCRIVR